jgi:hypothetical protein
MKSIKILKIWWKKDNNSKMDNGIYLIGRSWHAAHFCNLNLTFIFYSFWNIRRNVLKLKKFDEKRAITPKWIMEITLKLQGS